MLSQPPYNIHHEVLAKSQQGGSLSRSRICVCIFGSVHSIGTKSKVQCAEKDDTKIYIKKC